MINNVEKKFILDAYNYLEDPSLIMRLVNLIGQPIELGTKKLPQKIQTTITESTNKALMKALEITLKTVKSDLGDEEISFDKNLSKSKKSHWTHVAGSATTGAIGGFFGIISLPIELPITTGIMLRSIADSGKIFGFDPNSSEFKTECLYVFTLGSKGDNNDAMESSYYTSRLGFQHIMNQAAKFMAEQSAHYVLEGAKKGTAPIIIEFLTAIASRFEITVTEKFLFEMVPIVGALGGASINSAFTDHFASAGKYHFGLKHLEKKYGPELIKSIYESHKSEVA